MLSPELAKALNLRWVSSLSAGRLRTNRAHTRAHLRHASVRSACRCERLVDARSVSLPPATNHLGFLNPTRYSADRALLHLASRYTHSVAFNIILSLYVPVQEI
jgi:hypothetical protein